MECYGHFIILFFCCPKIAFIFLIFRDLQFVANAINELNDFNKAVFVLIWENKTFSKLN